MASLGLITVGLLSMIFGLLVLISPKFLRFVVGIYFIGAGLFALLAAVL